MKSVDHQSALQIFDQREQQRTPGVAFVVEADSEGVYQPNRPNGALVRPRSSRKQRPKSAKPVSFNKDEQLASNQQKIAIEELDGEFF